MDQDDTNPYRSPLVTEAPVPLDDKRSGGKLADRAARLLAMLVDVCLELAITFPALFAFGYFDRYVADQATWLDELLYALASLALHYLIHGYWLATRGQTVGKRLLGIRIEDRQTSELLSMSRMVFLRDLPIMLPVYLLPILTMTTDLEGLEVLVLFVDAAFIFTASRRCLHDRIANTKVVRTWS